MPNAVWTKRVQVIVRDVAQRWSLSLETPFHRSDTSWVAPGTRRDGTPIVLKIGRPHMEAEHEIAGLRFWAGSPTVVLLEADEALHALLLERCHPGSSLRTQPEAEQDRVIAGLLKLLWRRPDAAQPFRPLSAMIDYWCAETLSQRAHWPDRSLVERGVRAFQELAQPGGAPVLLATDLHAGNVLAARREPWLVIDPKPFVGDPAYDATQHLFNCRERMTADPGGTIVRFAKLLDIDHARVRLWMFARAAAEPRSNWSAASLALARALEKS
jgi:streptomycin 6-kinase